MRFIELHRQNGTVAAEEPFLVNLDKIILINKNQIVTEADTPVYVRESYEELKGIIRAVSEMECRYDKYFEKVGDKPE